MSETRDTRETVVVIGNGMVGHRFCERLVEFDEPRRYGVVAFCEEPRAAYDRVGLTSYFEHRNAERLMLARLDWYRDSGIELHVGDRATAIDRDRRIVRSEKGLEIAYDRVILATGSYPFMLPVPGVDKKGVFVYRTIDDLERIVEYAKTAERVGVVGGGLLGLEAAKAAHDLGLETHVVEFAPRLMPRQVDETGSSVLVRRIEELGVSVHLSKGTREVVGNGKVEGMVFEDGSVLDVQMIIVSAGIRPRDELARQSGIALGERGGVVVDDRLQTSDPRIFAIGEVALHRGTVYGLVAPGYEMAEVVAANLAGEDRLFEEGDLSAKLKLMGVDVASFGDHAANGGTARALVYHDPIAGIYKKLVFSADGTRLLGGILVGDASDYGALLALSRRPEPLEIDPGSLVVGGRAGEGGARGLYVMDDDAQVCSCNNVNRGAICAAIGGKGLTTVGQIKSCTKAGAGCGGCVPLLTSILHQQLESSGKKVNAQVCEHFSYTRQELFAIVKVKEIQSFEELLVTHGSGDGCEVCKPVVASILASLWNENILDHATLQDTNDRFLANMQRGGLYSVIPRVPGGEITPEKLIVLGEVAKQYGLYTKITGAQRVDLFGARLHQLPEIWEKLVQAGFESGHAYGKALRTVKSCVGTTWCRYGVQDSVDFAIRIEQRYRGIRAPHKVKAAVSGCVRECAEAQGKDFGLVATENGYNLYVGGNGGSKPRHADLLAVDLDEETCIKYIDRFFMYYIMTADKLMRTASWIEKLEGGLDHLRDVIIHDKLGICEELERRMQYLVDTYKCEWKEVVRDPEKRKLFRQFVNTDETEAGIQLVGERGQHRPVDWPKNVVPADSITLPGGETIGESSASACGSGRRWVQVAKVWDFPEAGGAAVKYGKTQIAVFHFQGRGEWYATQNMCPHMNAFVLSRGIIGDSSGTPKVACPLHKKTFDLSSGHCMSGESYELATFPVQVKGDDVYLRLPSIEDLDDRLATEKHRIGASCAGARMGSST